MQMDNHRDRFLRLYDQQLRTEAETPGAQSITRLGPLRLATYANGRGFTTYPHFSGKEPQTLAQLAGAALEHFAAQPRITEVEFKTRGHDHAPGLAQRLEALGFIAEESESIMIGPLQALLSGDPGQAGLELRRVSAAEEIEEMCRMVDQAFGEPYDPATTQALISRMGRNDGMELWVAWLEGRMAGAGRLEPVAGTEFAGLWGGGVLPEYRGRGVYRALVDARARSAIAMGCKYVHSDSTEYSRPILERQGLVKVSTTAPYIWKRAATGS